MAPVPVTKFSLKEFNSNVCLNCSVKFISDGEMETQRINFLEVLDEEKEAVSVWSAINTIFKIPINRQIDEEEGIPFGCCPGCATLLDSLYELHRQLDRVRNLDSVVSKIVERNQQAISAALKPRTVDNTDNANEEIDPLQLSPEELDRDPLHISPEDMITEKSGSGRPNVRARDAATTIFNPTGQIKLVPLPVPIPSPSRMPVSVVQTFARKLQCLNCCVEIQLISDVSKRPSVKEGVGAVTIGLGASNKIEIPDILNGILKLPPRNKWTADLKMCVDCARILIHIHMYSSNLESVAKPESRLNCIIQDIRGFIAQSCNGSSSSSGFPSLPGTQPSKNVIAKVLPKGKGPNADTRQTEAMEVGDSQTLENSRLNPPVRNDRSISDRDRASTTNIPAIANKVVNTNTDRAISTPKPRVTTQKNEPKPNGTGPKSHTVAKANSDPVPTPKSRNSVLNVSEDPGRSRFPKQATAKKYAVEQKISGSNDDDSALHNRSGLRSQIKSVPLPNPNDSGDAGAQESMTIVKKKIRRPRLSKDVNPKTPVPGPSRPSPHPDLPEPSARPRRLRERHFPTPLPDKKRRSNIVETKRAKSTAAESKDNEMDTDSQDDSITEIVQEDPLRLSPNKVTAKTKKLGNNASSASTNKPLHLFTVPIPNDLSQNQPKKVLRKRRVAASEVEITNDTSGRASSPDITFGPSPPRRIAPSASVGHVTPGKRRARSDVGHASPSPARRRALSPLSARRRGASAAGAVSNTKHRGGSAGAVAHEDGSPEPELGEEEEPHCPSYAPEKKRRCHECYHYKNQRRVVSTQYECTPCNKPFCTDECFQNYHSIRKIPFSLL